MKKTAPSRARTTDEYLAGFPRPVQTLLRQVRSTIRKAVPSAEEQLSYGIPTYKLNGRPLIYFAGWKEHYSIYPSGSALVAAFRDDLARYEVEKGTIRFPLDEPVPVKLIEGIAKFRAKEVSERATTTTKKKKLRTAGAA